MTASKQGLTLLRCRHACNSPVPNVQYKTPVDGHRRCPKHAEFFNRINLYNYCVWLVIKKKKKGKLLFTVMTS
jgi:hypothetical protein